VEEQVTDAGFGLHLVQIHDHLREELNRIRDLVDQVTSGEAEPAQARSHIAEMTIRQNSWTVGAYCASYCRVLTTHHTIEDAGVFPHLRAQDPSLGPVLDRLSADHLEVHALLEELDRALVAFVSGPGGAVLLADAVRRLDTTLRAHLAYEEQHLVGPLDRFGYY
jgi:hypothetical protein